MRQIKIILNSLTISFMLLSSSVSQAADPKPKTKIKGSTIEKEDRVNVESNILRFTQALKSTSGIFKPIQITISIFDPDKNPVLIEFSFASEYSHLNFIELDKFEVIRNPKTKTNDFRIVLKNKYFTDDNGDTKQYYKNFAILPFTIEILNKTDIHVVQETAYRNTLALIDASKTFVDKLNNLNFSPLKPLIPLNVREPSTLLALSYEQYFKPKGIEFPLIRKTQLSDLFHSTSSGGSYGSYTYKPTPPINSASDIKLTGSLKNKENIIWKLLEQKTKPTLTEFLETIAVTPKKKDVNPFRKYSSNSSLLKELEEDLPYAIAQFETAFPNATWYALGRDIYLFGDAMDAFYKYQNQEGRVRRLAASQPSFDENNVDEVIEFLESNDFDFVNMSEKSQPQIIFDITSYSKGVRFSQSSQLMRAAYAKWEKLGRDPKKLLKLVNFVSVSSGPHKMIDPELDIESFFDSMTFDPAPTQILRVKGPMSLQYSTAWHGIYEKFQRNAKGKVTAPFHHPSSNREKLAMLAELWDVAAVVMSDDFIKKVKKEMKNLAKKTTSKPISIEKSKKTVDCVEVLSKPIGS